MRDTELAFRSLMALVLTAALIGCATQAPTGGPGQPNPQGAADDSMMNQYASEPSASVPSAGESAESAPRPGQDRPDVPEPVVSDRTRTSTEGALVGALIGGLVGGFGVGGPEAALIGAALGAGAGFLVADQIAKRKEQYASEEEFLDSEISTAVEFNRTAAAYNDQLRGEIDALDISTEELLRQYRQGVVTFDAIEARRDAVQEKIAETDQVREDLLKEYEIKLAVYDEQKEKRHETDAYLGALARELNKLDQNIQSLKSGSLELAQIEDRLTV